MRTGTENMYLRAWFTAQKMEVLPVSEWRLLSDVCRKRLTLVL